MQAGRLRHHFTILRPTVTVNPATGARTKETYTSVGTFWGELKTVSGRELDFVRGYSETANHTVIVRLPTDLLTSDRVQLGTRKFSVDAILNDEPSGEFATVLCAEVKGK